jgi:small subunit ribosomal protein S1
MPDPSTPDSEPMGESAESFGEALSEYERSHSPNPAQEGGQGRGGTVVAVSAESVFVDIGYKSEGILPLAAFQGDREPPKPGDRIRVTVKGRDPEGYYELTRGKVEQPTDWESLEKAFAEKATIVGTVTAMVKGGLSVDIGVRSFMPASRTGTRNATEMEKLVGQEIRCRITKLDLTDENVVVDRRVIAEDEETAAKQRRYCELKQGDTVRGTVRSLTDYGAFVDIGEVDALLHIAEISWSRVNKPSDVLSVGDQVEAVILKIDSDKRRISLSMKQLQRHPWDSVAEKYAVGDRVRGVVTRLVEFGAFVGLEPGIEGLIHISEMSWAKRVRNPSEVVKPGETVEAVILGVNVAERRISLGLKQTLGDPWADAAQKLGAGSVVEGPITNITKFGAFVQIAEGVEGMVHVSEISAEKRISHPSDVLKIDQRVKALVLSLDPEKRLMRLSMKQLAPTGLDEYISEHKAGDVVTGRMIEIDGGFARVELGEGIHARCRVISARADSEHKQREAEPSARPREAELSSLGSMLEARWKGATRGEGKVEARAGQVREFRIIHLDAAGKKIELELL